MLGQNCMSLLCFAAPKGMPLARSVNPNGRSPTFTIEHFIIADVFSMIRRWFWGKQEGNLIPLKGQFRGADAVEQDKDGNYYVSSWTQGTVWKIDGKTEKTTVLIDGLESAADFYLEEDKGRLLLPDMLTGLIHAVEINNL